MAISIVFGVDSLEYLSDEVTEDGNPYSSLMDIVDWVGDCDFEDSTDDNLSVSKNTPHYCFSSWEAEDWTNRYPDVKELMIRFDILNNPCAIPVKDVLELVDRIKSKSTKSKLDKNRAKWLHFWANQAVNVFGDRARIVVSG